MVGKIEVPTAQDNLNNARNKWEACVRKRKNTEAQIRDLKGKMTTLEIDLGNEKKAESYALNEYQVLL